MLGEIKGKGAHHGSLTDFRVVVLWRLNAAICIANWDEQSALNSLTRIHKLPVMEVPSLQVIPVVNFHLKVIFLPCNPKVQFRLVPCWIRADPDPLLQWPFSRLAYLCL